MKSILLIGAIALCVSCGAVEQPPADEILQMVQTKLPSDPIKLTGSLKVRTRNGFTKSNLPVEMKLNWGADPATAFYQIDNESLTITWNGDKPNYTFSNPENKAPSDILGTGLTWADLSFSMLWWPNSKLVGEEKKINREAYVVDVPVPDSDLTMRLWIEKYMGMVLEVQTLDKNEKMLRRLKIKSIKKMDGMWVAKDLELLDKKTGNKATLQIADLEWMAKKPTAAAFDATESINQLAIDLYQQAAKDEGNLFLSPYSISTALAMVYGGARGETETQMNKTLHLGGQGATHPAFSNLRKKLNGIQEKGNVQLSIANSLWPQVDYPFLPDYLGMTKEFYGVDIEPVDFKTDPEAARLRINNWVAAKTADKIKDLLSEGTVTTQTRLVLANAVYFKGNWETEFVPGFSPGSMTFKITENETVEVSTLVAHEGMYASNETFQVLELPYKDKDLSMLIFLPHTQNGLHELEPSLPLESLAALKTKFNSNMLVIVPKFSFSSSTDLGTILEQLGMNLPFSKEADFSGMAQEKVWLNSAVHETSITVAEKGTEAIAATSLTAYGASIQTNFIANHPFLFLIRENSTGTILFIGRVVDPTQ